MLRSKGPISAWNAVAGVNRELIRGNITAVGADLTKAVANWPIAVQGGVRVELTTAAIFGLQPPENTQGVSMKYSKRLGGECLGLTGVLYEDSLCKVNVQGAGVRNNMSVLEGNSIVDTAYRGPLIAVQLMLDGGRRDVLVPFSVPSLRTQHGDNMAHLLTGLRVL